MNGTRAIAVLIALLNAIVGAPAHAQPNPTITGEIVFPNQPISLVDRTTIDITLTSPPGVAVEPWIEIYEASLAEAGWTIVDTSAAPPALAPSGGVVHRVSIIVEPFLDGQYAVPDLRLSLTTPNGKPAEAFLDGGIVTVESVLPEEQRNQSPPAPAVALPGSTDQQPSDEADAPLGTLRPPPPEPDRFPGTVVLAGTVGLIVAAGVAVLILTRIIRGRGRGEPDAARSLQRLARSDQADTRALDKAHELLRTVLRAHGGADRPDAADLLERFEHARYGPHHAPEQVRALIADAADLARALGAPARDAQGGGGAPA